MDSERKLKKFAFSTKAAVFSMHVNSIQRLKDKENLKHDFPWEARMFGALYNTSTSIYNY